MNKMLANQSKVMLVSDMTLLIQTCLFALYLADTVAADNPLVISPSPISQPRQLKWSVWILENSPGVFLNKTLEPKLMEPREGE